MDAEFSVIQQIGGNITMETAIAIFAIVVAIIVVLASINPLLFWLVIVPLAIISLLGFIRWLKK